MCGRFALHLRNREIRNVPGRHIEIQDWVDEQAFIPRYNIAPRTYAPVIRRGDQPDASYVLHSMKWGLVPHWSKHEDKSLSTTNARAENLVEGGGLWQSIKGKKRCAVVAEGFYEWLSKGKKDKIPHFTKHRDGRVMLMAGLYDCAYLEGSTEPLYTFTIVTTIANKESSWLHDRQPVILATQEALDTWLDTTPQKWTKELTVLVESSYQDETAPLECYRVPQEVGKVGVESPTFIEPVANAMFSRQKARLRDEHQLVSESTTATMNQQLSPSPSSSRYAASSSPTKRPRSGDTPTIDLEANEKDEIGHGHGHGDVDSAAILSSPPRKKQRKTTTTAASPSSPLSPPRRPNQANQTSKITSFFSKR